MALNKKFIKEWIKVLRSGDYKQTKNALKDDKGFCCLGVACDIHDDSKWHCFGIEGNNVWSYDNESEILPSNLTEFIGIDDSVQNKLVRMNDIDRKSFNEIADYLENILKTNVSE